MSTSGERARARSSASPAGELGPIGAPYRVSARPAEPAEPGPRPVALGFVVVWFLLAIQAFRVWDDPGGSRALIGLGLGIITLCVVVPCLPRTRSQPR